MKGFFHKEGKKQMTISWRRVWIIVIAVVVVCGVLATGTVVYTRSYNDRVLPGVSLGDVHIGGMNRYELRNYIQTMHTKLSDSGISVTFFVDEEEKNFIIYPTSVASDDVYESIHIDIEQEVGDIIAYRKPDNMIARVFSVLWVRMSQPTIQLSTIKLDKTQLKQQIEDNISKYIQEPHDASFDITSVDPLTYTITSSTIGRTFDYEKVFGHVIRAWSVFELPEIQVVSVVAEPDVVEDDVLSVTSTLITLFDPGRIDLVYTDPVTKRPYEWYISPQEMADWLIVIKDDDIGDVSFSLRQEDLDAFVEKDIAEFINVEPQDAKFEVGSNGKVTVFQGARPGVEVDIEVTLATIREVLAIRMNGDVEEDAIIIALKETDPNILTSEVNDLGIKEILGYGHSKFTGSPGNRINNLRVAVYNKLHGYLIKPGEEFSLIQALQPFTVESGYVPELVIKGDRIVPEMGGGLCQVGTTMFRAAMNSGMLITERRNHSLVVPYYNDLSNGLPGTDATIYSPHPDFRFKNDTSHHVLITTELNTATADLYIYLWGTNDGRKGYYAPPKVHRWIPHGPDKIIETTNLTPGKKECQYAYKGAETSFVYTRELPNGEKVDQVFESYYRPLPRICLVGVEEKLDESACIEGDAECIVQDNEDSEDDSVSQDEPVEEIETSEGESSSGETTEADSEEPVVEQS